ncbi:hypothetical protein [Nostoc sp. GT001]|uniref:hypothetical protein n=1 Tax=Nostoc sp. GT001 TaxID=3056647 RepID=UPI0025AA461F|nr:hypothetical protein [Nostoc sp. GT001]MDM9583111.1 hypothetical protein [Nostoc sp. GT001]
MAVKQKIGVELINANINLTHNISVQCPINSLCVDQPFFVADGAYLVTGVSYVHSTAGSDGSAVNLQITKDTGTTAPGAGTDLLTNNTNAGFDCKGTANTVQAGALVATEATRTLASGDRLSLDFAGTVTALAGVVVTVSLRRV